nr:hypothetical protein [Paraflavitalea speifideiaquila]
MEVPAWKSTGKTVATAGKATTEKGTLTDLPSILVKMMFWSPPLAVSGTRKITAFEVLNTGLKAAGTLPLSNTMDRISARSAPVKVNTVPPEAFTGSSLSALGLARPSLASFYRRPG